mmetsp:Transcript_18616/g.41291  ORF Transcript_18616/g.41291 Transcript_18616/m.41291 type:complete len:268 (+) Transcript_18616:617-1420(+)
MGVPLVPNHSSDLRELLGHDTPLRFPGPLLRGHFESPQQEVLLRLQRRQLRLDVRIDVVCYVHPIDDLRGRIVPPLLILQHPLLAVVSGIHTGSTVQVAEFLFGHEFLLRLAVLPIHIHLCFFLLLQRRRNKRRPGCWGPGGGHMYSVHNGVGLVALDLVVQSPLQQRVAPHDFHLVDPHLGGARSGHHLHGGPLTIADGVEQLALRCRQILHLPEIQLVQHHQQWLALEQGFDGMEQSHLLLQGETTGLGDVHKKKGPKPGYEPAL